MSDRKYRQRGYQDDDRGRASSPPSGLRKPPEPRDPRIPRDPRVPNMPGFREVFRCSQCGQLEGADVGSQSRCAKCGVDLHACIHCTFFDAGARFECMQPVTVRIMPKNVRNECGAYSPRMKVERETGSTPVSGGSAAKKAFDDLFKF